MLGGKGDHTVYSLFFIFFNVMLSAPSTNPVLCAWAPQSWVSYRSKFTGINVLLLLVIPHT